LAKINHPSMRMLPIGVFDPTSMRMLPMGVLEPGM